MICAQTEDCFTVSSSKGNGELSYPVGLITVDEAAFAGGVYLTVNREYYLYSGQTYWTMSPFSFDSTNANAYVWYIDAGGPLYMNWVASAYGVRPVVNLKNGIKALSGDGTASNPYVIG